MVVINVYAPCDFADKALLWDMINLVITQNMAAKICVVGDFNSIRAEGERCGRGGVIDRRDIRLFDDFISTGGLVDLQLWGRKYTWYKPDGSCKNKLDQIMVNEEWVEWKPDLKLKSLGRSIFDHCPLFLGQTITDWGPKPFKFFNGWVQHPDFKGFCKTKWELYSVAGWKSFSLKERLKLLKKDLKGWSREVFGGIQHKIENQRGDIECWDRVDDVFGLEEEEVIERNKIEAELKRNMIWNDKFLFQKARSKWLNEGDVNSKFFHRWINKRIKTNGIEGLFVNEEWVESKEGVRSAIFSHFRSHYSWWKDLVSVYSSGDGSALKPMLRKEVGNGSDTDFWGEWWVGEQPLKQGFNRIFRISLQQTERIEQMGYWSEGSWLWDFRWARRLNSREVESVHDVWRWTGDTGGCFSVKKECSEMLRILASNEEAEDPECGND
ncbi:hypothetical protein ACS0TY_020933 [Phlomoides rotata]